MPSRHRFRLLPLLAALTGVALAQAKPAAKPAPADSPTGGFAIESEMLTYSAVERNSAAVACDVARVLEGAAGAAGLPCKLPPPAQPLAPVVLVSPSSELLADFQVWRSDMATMQLLHQGARDVCGVTRGAAADKASGAAAHILDLTPEAQALGLVQTALGMFGGASSRGALMGSVEDQALMNAVGRELRALHVPVLLPEAYFPNALNLTAYADSPFFSAFGQLVADRDACTQALTHHGGDTDSIKQLSGEMDAFMAGVKGTGAGAATPAGRGGSPAGAGGPLGAGASHFAEVVLADGFARALGYTAAGAVPTGWHVLWLKALESGGSEWRDSGVFGSSERLSGGSVVTFALFNPDGGLACSGNVFSMAGPLSLDEIRKLRSASDPPMAVFTPQSSCGN